MKDEYDGVLDDTQQPIEFLTICTCPSHESGGRPLQLFTENPCPIHKDAIKYWEAHIKRKKDIGRKHSKTLDNHSARIFMDKIFDFGFADYALLNRVLEALAFSSNCTKTNENTLFVERVLEAMPERDLESGHLCEQVNCPASLGTGECVEDPDIPSKRRKPSNEMDTDTILH